VEKKLYSRTDHRW